MSELAYNRFAYSEQRIINNRRKRNQELKRHIILLIVSILLFSIMAILVFSTKTLASDGSEEVLFKGYKTVQVMPGDSVYSIANDNYTKGFNSIDALANEVLFINNLSDDSILISGNFIIVPYYDTLNG